MPYAPCLLPRALFRIDLKNTVGLRRNGANGARREAKGEELKSFNLVFGIVENDSRLEKGQKTLSCPWPFAFSLVPSFDGIETKRGERRKAKGER